MATTPAPNTAPEIVPTRTPENTPVPGGGRWCWDAVILDWIDVTHAPDPVIDLPALNPINETTL